MLVVVGAAWLVNARNVTIVGLLVESKFLVTTATIRIYQYSI